VSMMRCDVCDRPVDTDEDVECVYDEVSCVFACSRCCDKWQEDVTGLPVRRQGTEP
jgi:hypothetical protein